MFKVIKQFAIRAELNESQTKIKNLLAFSSSVLEGCREQKSAFPNESAIFSFHLLWVPMDKSIENVSCSRKCSVRHMTLLQMILEHHDHEHKTQSCQGFPGPSNAKARF